MFSSSPGTAATGCPSAMRTLDSSVAACSTTCASQSRLITWGSEPPGCVRLSGFLVMTLDLGVCRHSRVGTAAPVSAPAWDRMDQVRAHEGARRIVNGHPLDLAGRASSPARMLSLRSAPPGTTARASSAARRRVPRQGLRRSRGARPRPQATHRTDETVSPPSRRRAS